MAEVTVPAGDRNTVDTPNDRSFVGTAAPVVWLVRVGIRLFFSCPYSIVLQLSLESVTGPETR